MLLKTFDLVPKLVRTNLALDQKFFKAKNTIIRTFNLVPKFIKSFDLVPKIIKSFDLVKKKF
jgi:hypothetical protein